jgi:flagellar biosynthesis protein FlhG
MHILPIASGKGGVGKSLFAANLAIALGQAGKSVILVDLDLGGSNLHLILGLRHLRQGIGTFLTDHKANLEDIVIQTEYKNVRFIPGDSEIPGMANLSAPQKKKLLAKLGSLEADYLILDLGAGTSLNTVDFFLLSNLGTIVTTPTPTALVNAYLFLKNSVFRILYSAVTKDSPAAKFLAQLHHNAQGLQKVYIQDLLRKIQAIDETSHRQVTTALDRFKPRLVMNMLEDPKDADKAWKIRRSCQQYLNIEIEHMGVMYRDDLQDTALQAGLPIISYKPRAVLSQAIYRIADKIIQAELEDNPDERPDLDLLDQSFETAEMEAEIDFQSKIEYVEDLLQTGALSTGDLLETIKNQQLEITALRKENMFIKSKLLKASQQGFKL